MGTGALHGSIAEQDSGNQPQRAIRPSGACSVSLVARAEYSAVAVSGDHRRDLHKERVDDANAGIDEISTVSRGDRQTMDGRRRSDQAVLNRHGFPRCAETRQQLRPFEASVRVPWQTMEALHARVEPAFQRGPFSSLGKNEDAASQLANNDGIDGDVRLVRTEPCHDARIGHWLRRLAQNVGVDEVLHSASVDSDSIGTKKSFRGQASSQSMTPSFGGAARRTKR